MSGQDSIRSLLVGSMVGVAFALGADGQKTESPKTPLIAFRDDDGNGKYGFVNQLGKVVIEPRYTYARDFVDGSALVKLDGKLCFIDEKENTRFTLPADTENAGDLLDGHVWFDSFRKNKWGLCNDKGVIVVPPTYDRVKPFTERLACVCIEAKPGPAGLMPIHGNWGFVKNNGDIVIPIKYRFASPFSDGLARVSDVNGTKFVDNTGKVKLDFGYAVVGNFREGLAPLEVDPPKGLNSRHTRYIDRDNRVIFTVDGRGYEFFEGMAVVELGSVGGEKPGPTYFGFIDRNGKPAIPPIYADARRFSEGFASVRVNRPNSSDNDHSWGFVDRNGKMHIEPQFNDVDDFRNGVAKVHIGGNRSFADDVPPWWENGAWWLIDKAGKRLKRLWKDGK